VRVAANGLEFELVDEGEGQPVVFLHGFPDTSKLWRPQIDALTAAGYRALAPDLRGRGQSDWPTDVDEYRLTKSVKDVVGIMDARGVERAHVVGHDFGAALAWLFASIEPDRVDHLVVVSVGFPNAELPDLEELQKGWYRLLFLFEGIAEELMQRDDWHFMRERFSDPAVDVEATVRELSKPGALTAGLNWYRANIRPARLIGPPSELPDVKAPTLGIFGLRDPYLAKSAMLASEGRVTGGWRYEEFDAGHWVMLEYPQRFNELLLEFLPRG
jgi:pimeloyl-ACP methyl ester carboxylesterase